MKIFIMLLHVDPLPGSDLKTTSTARQQILNKQVHAAITE
jgi:hypothetical protein